MKEKLNEELSELQAGFRTGRGTRNQILNLKMIIEKNRECNNDLYLCFIDYKKHLTQSIKESFGLIC